MTLRLSPMSKRRLRNFKANRRGYISLWIFLALFIISAPAEFLANDKPLIVKFDGELYFPVVSSYAETEFGGEFETEADYRDPFVQELITEKGWMLWPAVEYDYQTINYDLETPAPSPPTSANPLGTDDLARAIYGFRISVLFGLILTLASSVVGIAAGAVQGYFGGLLDLFFQRFIEIWSGLPTLFILIIVASIIVPSFWTLLAVLFVFSWTSLVGVDLRRAVPETGAEH